jgi:Mg-chelatase subunit ChlD
VGEEDVTTRAVFTIPSPRRRFSTASLLLVALTLPLAAASETPIAVSVSPEVANSFRIRSARPADIALAVVYDTSGSMRGTVRTASGRLEAKHIVAKRAFGAVIERLEQYTAPGADKTAKELDLAIVVFDGSRPREAIPMAPLYGDIVRRWLETLPQPDSSTPLGDAMAMAGRALVSTPAASKHLLVLTDGINTTGATPLAALTALQAQNQRQDQPIFVHVLALDIPPAVFSSLQKAGATLIGASDEKQLQSQLDFIFETQILVEAP